MKRQQARKGSLLSAAGAQAETYLQPCCTWLLIEDELT